MIKTLIIAEAGVNHNGDMVLAKEMIDIAFEAGADLVKFQTFRTNQLVLKSSQKANYQIENDKKYESQHEMLQRLELSKDNHEELLEYCKKTGIGFFSTAFDLGSLDYLHGIGLKTFKIPSGEITNFQYLEKVGSFKKDIILSTGMSNLNEISDAIQVLESQGVSRNQITVLHCTSAYPTPMMEVNLLAMTTIQQKLDVKIGYSDHTLGIEVPIAAVALGATVIEKHFTLNRSLVGPDHKASLEPEELIKMIASIRNIEMALGTGVKEIQPSESGNLAAIRKSLIASQKIRKGELFTSNNLTCKRPGVGLSPMKWNDFIGHKSKRDYEKDDLIEY